MDSADAWCAVVGAVSSVVIAACTVWVCREYKKG